MDTVTNNNSVTTTTGAPQAVASGPGSPSQDGTGIPVVPGKARIAISFLGAASDAEFIVASGDILAAMQGNASFPAPNPKLATVATARDAYVAAATAARDSRKALPLRDQTRAALVVLLRKLAHYVQVVSQGDRAVLLGSGFPLQRGRQSPVGRLPAPANLRAVRGKISGQVVARCRRDPRAGAYQWRCAPSANPAAALPVVTTLSANAQFDGLVPGVQYTVLACAIGSAGASDWSDPAVLMVV